MRVFGIGMAVVGAALSTLTFLPAASASTSPSPHIIDGGDAPSGPWGARMYAGSREICSATIIAPDWVLTARHCTQGAAQEGGDVNFSIGNVDKDKGEKAKGTEVHESPDVDIALVRIDHAVNTEYAKLGDTSAVKAGDTVKVYGWGATRTDVPEQDSQSQVLKVAQVKVTATDCDSGLGGYSVCAERIDGITAGGDSGGPMFDGDVQVGVASTSDRQSQTAYANLTRYRDWIKSVSGV